MGYTTEFTGKFVLNKILDDDTFDFLVKLNETRRMKREVDSKYGVEGEFFVDGTGFSGQDDDKSIIDYNRPPRTQPSLWCQWRPTEDRMGIEWDEGEKFYDYVEWLTYIVKNFLEPKRYILNGNVEWIGEDPNDRGMIVVKDNKITTKKAKIVYE